MKKNSIDERLSRVEATVKHLSRRLHKTVLGVIPPTLINVYVHKPMEDGTILTAALVDGKIKKGLMVVKKYLVTGKVEFTCKLTRPDGEFFTSFKTSKLWEEIDLDIDVEIGDVFDFSVSDPNAVEGIWVTFLFDATMENKKIVKQLRDQLEMIDEGI